MNKCKFGNGVIYEYEEHRRDDCRGCAFQNDSQGCIESQSYIDCAEKSIVWLEVKDEAMKSITQEIQDWKATDQATDQAVRDVAKQLNTTEQSLKDAIAGTKSDFETALGGVKTGLQSAIGGASTNVSNVQAALQKQISDNEAAGMSRSQATSSAIASLSAKLGTTEKGLLDAIQGVASDLGGQLAGVKTNLTGQMGDLEGRLNAQILANESAGMGRDEAIKSAVAGLGTQIGGLGTQLSGLGQGLGGLQEGLAGLSAGFGAYQASAAQAAAASKAAASKAAADRQKQEGGQQILNMLGQQRTGEVKTPGVAKIDYLYDIGGESLFATPKQESLMLSPFEDAPEPVEGAAPRYQYYSDGGLIGSDDLQTIDDLYEMLRGK